MKILAIETSCDETAAAIIEGTSKDKPLSIKSNIIASQIDIHSKFGGVFPEIASRAHAEQILPVIEEALEKGGSNKELDNIDAIGVTFGPGLIGSLLVGVAAAKTLAYITKKPIIPINHWEGHIYSNFVGVKRAKIKSQNAKLMSPLRQSAEADYFELPKFPSLILTVSGGHTSLILMHDHGKYDVIGRTRDDAAGEAFDKVAKLMGLPYPGGPVISAYAEKFKSQISNLKTKEGYLFPRPMINEPGFDFSFSGLKTAVLYTIKDKKLDEEEKSAVAAAFQEAAVDTLIKRTKQAAKKYKPASICLAGGVSANKLLRERFVQLAKELENKPSVHIPPLELTTDNAAMVGAAAYFRCLAQQSKKWYDVKAEANAVLV